MQSSVSPFIKDTLEEFGFDSLGVKSLLLLVHLSLVLEPDLSELLLLEILLFDFLVGFRPLSISGPTCNWEEAS